MYEAIRIFALGHCAGARASQCHWAPRVLKDIFSKRAEDRL
jgi:hypothetical protein